MYFLNIRVNINQFIIIFENQILISLKNNRSSTKRYNTIIMVTFQNFPEAFIFSLSKFIPSFFFYIRLNFLSYFFIDIFV